MPIHPHLLDQTQAAAARLAAAEKEFDTARAEYHGFIRRIHLAGAPLREIADALGMSHQRIQQIVGSAGGTWWNRVWRTRNARRNLVCTFCRRTDQEVAKLIAGPGVFICERCVAAAMTAHAPFTPSRDGSRTRCAFCRKTASATRRVLAGLKANICSDCAGVCRQIVADSGE